MDTYVFTFLRWRSCTSLPYPLEEGHDRRYTGKSHNIIIAMLFAIPLPSHQTTLKSTENPPRNPLQSFFRRHDSTIRQIPSYYNCHPHCHPVAIPIAILLPAGRRREGGGG